MTAQSEQALENNLIKQLQVMLCEWVEVSDEFALFANLKNQNPKSKEPFKISRSKIDLFLNCQGCDMRM